MAILLMSASGGKASERTEGQVKERQTVPKSAGNLLANGPLPSCDYNGQPTNQPS